jgi:multicomponent Na+:H+ antiporter subunit E
MIAALTLVWCGLWGSVSVANVAAGLLIAVILATIDLGLPGSGGIRLLPLVKLTGLVLVDLVRSTFSVAKEILTRDTLADEAIVAVKAPAGSRQHLLLLIVLITLTPGTAVVDADPTSDTLYLHLLYRGDEEKTKAHVTRIANLACQALPTAQSESDLGSGSGSDSGTTV